MNKDQVKGVSKQIKGKILEETGKITGNKDTQLKGLQNQVAGKAEQTFGDAKEVIKATVKKHSL